MRICVINEYFYPDNTGGTGTVLSELARSLCDRHDDVQIDVLTSVNLYRENGSNLEAEQDWQGIQIRRIKTPKPNGLSTPKRLVANLHFSLASLLKLFRQQRYDVLLIGTAPPMVALAAYIYKKLTGTPYVYIVYDLEPDRAVVMNVLSARHPFVRLLRVNQQRWLQEAAKIVVLGRCMRDYVANAYDLTLERFAVISTGADPKEIVPAPRTTEFRAKHKVDGFVVLYSGNFGRYHNFDTILDAAVELQKQQAPVTFVLVGDGQQKEHIYRRVADEQIGNVRLFPFVAKDDYCDLLATADASLVTLEPGMEGLCVPSKFFSILASGRPTIGMVSPTSEVARVVDEAECGVHLYHGDSARLVEVLLDWTGDQELLERMGRNAREVLIKQFSTEIVADDYNAVLREAAGLPAVSTTERTPAPVLESLPAAVEQTPIS